MLVGHANELTQQRRVKKPLDLSLFPCKMGFRYACFVGFLECGYLRNAPLSPEIFTPLEPVTNYVTLYGKEDFAYVIKICNLNVFKP